MTEEEKKGRQAAKYDPLTWSKLASDLPLVLRRDPESESKEALVFFTLKKRETSKGTP